MSNRRKMQLVEQHIIKDNNPHFKLCDELCFKTKNLYNSCLYVIRQAYIHDKVNLMYNLHGLMKDTVEYKELPAKVSSTVILTVQKNFKSYFKSLSSYYKDKSKFNGRPKLPGYLDTENGRFFASYTNQAISKKIFKKTNKIKLSKIDIEFKTCIDSFDKINCVRIIPKKGYYVIEVVYTIDDIELKDDNKRYLAIDTGVNNLAVITTNDKKLKPVLINGKPLKSINQYYNKKLSFLRSELELKQKRKISKNINKLTLKRTNKINYYLYNASNKIINFALNNNINTIIIGKNDKWKQDVNNGKKNNQNFVNIPHSRFIDYIKYKCELKGINIIIQEESYTSKASFLNLDEIPVYEKGSEQKYKFSGYRLNRGLYKVKGSNKTINADVNGSYNIMRKAIPNVFSDGIEGAGVHPFKL